MELFKSLESRTKSFNDPFKHFEINQPLTTDAIKEISKAKNLPVLVFTHPKDPFDGLLSDWVEKIPGVKRVIISEDYKINNK